MPAAESSLRERMEAEPDVLRVLELAALPGGQSFRYLIETPHSFPRFVIGETDAACERVAVAFRCGEERSAREHWRQGRSARG